MKSLVALLTEFRGGKGLKGQLLRGGFWSLVIKLLSTLMALLTAVVLARVLGAEGFGIYSFVFALVSILAIPAQMGLPNLVVRETAKAQAAERWDVMKGLWRWSSLTALGMSLVLVVLGGLAALLFANQLGEAQTATLWWGLLLVPLVALGNLRGAALRGLRKVVQGQLPEFVLRPALLIVLVLVVSAFAYGGVSPATVMLLHVTAGACAFAVGAALIWRERPSQIKSAARTNLSSEWIRSAIPLALIGGMDVISQNISLVVLGAFGNTDETAFFRVAAQCALSIGFLSAVTKLLTAPYISQLHASGDKAKVQKLVKASSRATFLFSSAVSLTFLAVAPFLIPVVFGQEFEGAVTPLYILMIGQLVSSFGSPGTTLLNMTDNERETAIATGLALVVNCLGVAFLAPTFGAVGAAFASVISVVAWQVFLWLRSYQRLGVEVTAFGAVGRRLARIFSKDF